MINKILGVIFILFAIVQWNDPDPYLWIALYSFVGIVCFFAAYQKYHRGVLVLGMLIGLGWGLFLLPEFIQWLNMGMPSITGSMKAEQPHIEFTREFLGLLICLAVLTYHFFKAQKIR